MKRIADMGGLSVLLAGGADRAGGGDGPIVVLLHGFGAPGDDLAPLWRVIDAPAGTRWVFPEAPVAVPGLGGGRAWWMIDVERYVRAAERGQLEELEREEPEGLETARERAIALLEAVHSELRPTRVLLGGFSQGAMLSCDVALRTERPLAGLVLLSGSLVARDEWAPKAVLRRGLPVFQSHGLADPLLPFAQAEKVRDLLRGGGAEVTWVPFRGGHEIPPTVVDALGRWTRSALRD
jgi:phospholipase/carboxylesterase